MLLNLIEGRLIDPVFVFFLVFFVHRQTTWDVLETGFDASRKKSRRRRRPFIDTRVGKCANCTVLPVGIKGKIKSKIFSCGRQLNMLYYIHIYILLFK